MVLNWNCHNVIEIRCVGKTKEISSNVNDIFFSMRHNKHVTVYVEITVSLEDQPERREINYPMLGNAFSLRFGNVFNIR